MGPQASNIFSLEGRGGRKLRFLTRPQLSSISISIRILSKGELRRPVQVQDVVAGGLIFLQVSVNGLGMHEMLKSPFRSFRAARGGHWPLPSP